MFTVVTFYHFFDFADFTEQKKPLLDLLKKHNIKGSILIAAEGFNGTISGTREDLDAVLAYLRKEIAHSDFDTKESTAEKQPFGRAKVRLKKELISLGEPVFVRHPGEGRDPYHAAGEKNKHKTKNPCGNKEPTLQHRSCDSAWIPAFAGMTGEYVEAKDWNALIADPDTIILDTRNAYETHLGTFKNAIDPGIRTFKQLPDFVRKKLKDAKHQKIATFCTGGIRCEKFTAWMKQEGFEQVYHLKGGILKYLEDVPEQESRWEGECYVFDERVAIGHGLKNSETTTMCKACGHPLTPKDREHALYIEGKACGFCG